MITISKPFIKDVGDFSRLTSNIIVDDNLPYQLYYEVKKEYKEYLTYELSDAFLVCLMLWAMEHKHDIKCEAPISERLYRQLKEYLIPAISKNIKEYSKINIISSTANIRFNGEGVGTGLSCGVDSFYTILKNLNHSEESKLNITHLCYFNVGASGGDEGDVDNARHIYQERMKEFEIVAKELGRNFLTVDSNMNEFLRQPHEATHVFRTLSVPLALQKLFHLYYFSSSAEYSMFKFVWYDCSFYDLLNMQAISNDNLRFEMVGGETTRQGKIEFIDTNKIVQNHLNVCIRGIHNDNTCLKCKRTILNLYIDGKLDDFRNVFDVDYFYKNKSKFLTFAVKNKKLVDMPEINKFLKQKHMLPLRNRIEGNILRFLRYMYFSIRKCLKSILKIFSIKKTSKKENKNNA